MHERGREAHPLAHAAGVPLEPTVLRVLEPHGLDRAADCSVTIRNGLQARGQLHELASGEEVVDGFVLWHVADLCVEARVIARRLAEDGNRAA